MSARLLPYWRSIHKVFFLFRSRCLRPPFSKDSRKNKSRGTGRGKAKLGTAGICPSNHQRFDEKKVGTRHTHRPLTFSKLILGLGKDLLTSTTSSFRLMKSP